MAATPQAPFLPPLPQIRSAARPFTLGRPAWWWESITGGIGSFFDLLRPRLDDERPPLGRTLAKLMLWIVVGAGMTAGSLVALALTLTRAFTIPVG